VSIAAVEGSGMKKEAALLNIICILAAIGLLALAAWNAISSGDFFTTDNLFLISVCLVLALMFAINPLVSLYQSGKLPLPFKKGVADTKEGLWGAKASAMNPQVAGTKVRALLDAKGRPVPPDVRAMVERMNQPQEKPSD
jgi:hypothetical protein